MPPSHPRLPAVAAALALGVLVAVGVPYGELWRACRAPTSEACVWGKSLLPVSLAVGAGLGAVAAAVGYVCARAWQRRRPAPGDGGDHSR